VEEKKLAVFGKLPKDMEIKMHRIITENLDAELIYLNQ